MLSECFWNRDGIYTFVVLRDVVVVAAAAAAAAAVGAGAALLNS